MVPPAHSASGEAEDQSSQTCVTRLLRRVRVHVHRPGITRRPRQRLTCALERKGASIHPTSLPRLRCDCENGPKLDLPRPQRTEMTSPFCTGGRAIVVLDEKTTSLTYGQGARRNLMELRRGACGSVTFCPTQGCTTPEVRHAKCKSSPRTREGKLSGCFQSTTLRVWTATLN